MKALCFWSVIVCCIFCFTGCQNAGKSSQDSWLLVSFEKNVPITYKMTSERQTEIDLTTSDPNKKSRPQTTTEKLELVMVYTPVKVDPFGLSTLNVKCKSAKVTRLGFSGRQSTKDVMETLPGKSFILKLTPTGQIAETDDLERLATQLGAASFSDDKNMRIKNPDMISDFLVMQQYLWAASSTISNQLNLKIGDTWQVQQAIPWPVPIYPPPGRITTYTLEDIQSDENNSRRAVITSTYAKSETPIEEYLRPYEEGKFQMRGLFGFLRNFKFEHIEGTGKQIFNMEDGLVESDQQEYLLNVTANFMLPLGNSLPILKVDQKISIERIETPTP